VGEERTRRGAYRRRRRVLSIVVCCDAGKTAERF